MRLWRCAGGVCCGSKKVRGRCSSGAGYINAMPQPTGVTGSPCNQWTCAHSPLRASVSSQVLQCFVFSFDCELWAVGFTVFNCLAPQAALRRATSRQHYLGTTCISAPGWSPAQAWDPYQPQLPSRPTCASCHTAPIQHVYERSVVVIIAWSRVLQAA